MSDLNVLGLILASREAAKQLDSAGIDRADRSSVFRFSNSRPNQLILEGE